MTTKTESLIERARLTEEEIGTISDDWWLGDGIDDMRQPGPVHFQEIAEAALAKALWAVVDWIEEGPIVGENVRVVYERRGDGLDIDTVLRHQLEAAGLAGPK